MARVGETAGELAFTERICNAVRDDDTAEWNVPRVDSLGETDEVWCDIPMINREPLAATTKTTHDFVTDHDDAVTITDSANAFEVSRWWNQDSICADHGFHNDCRYIIGAFDHDGVFKMLQCAFGFLQFIF